MRNIFFIIFLLILSSQSNAQFLRADYKKAQIMYHRPVIVPLFNVEDAEDECEALHMIWYNEVIREVMPKYWTLNDSIIFMDKKMLTSIIGSASPEYAVFSAGASREGQQSSSDIYWSRTFTFMLFLSEDGRRLDPQIVDRNSPLIPDTDMSGQLLRGRYIFKLSFDDFFLSEDDLVFAIKQFNENVNLALDKKYPKKGVYAQKIPKEVSSRLKSMTLLIPNDLDPEGLNEEMVNKYYKQPFRMASQEEIGAAITSKAENTAYLHYLWSDKERMFLGAVIDTKSSELLAVLSPGAAKLDRTECLPPGISNRTLLRLKAKKLKGLSRLVK